MTSSLTSSAVVLAIMGLGLAAAPARADLYSLEGRFACLGSGAASCGDTTPSPVPVRQRDTVIVKPEIPMASLPRSVALSHPAPPAPASSETIAHLWASIRTGRVGATDLAQLHALARSGNARAIEMLAWCDYAGVGVPRDPMAAYLLYGVAASAGLERAQENQSVIYEYALTPDQRQLVLDVHNAGLPAESVR